MLISRQRVLSELRYAGVFMVACIVQTYFTCRSCNTLEEYLPVACFTFILWVLCWRGNSALTHYINEKISWFKFPIKRLVVGLVTTIGYTLLAVIGSMLLFERLFDLNFGRSFVWSIYFAIGITIFISLILHSREFLLRGIKATLNAEVLEKESIRAKYESLKSQISPHFLFNSLNALTNLVYEDQDKAAKFIKQLSEVYRYVLDSRDKEVVPLEEEKKFLMSYMFLQEIRFGDKLRLDLNVASSGGLVAPLVLQMLVENAIKHNVISEEHPLTILIYVEEAFIVVENEIRKKPVIGNESQGIGLDNIIHRYEYLSDRKVEVTVENTFRVRLPVIPDYQTR